jgi:S1-C subfamily serine protease
VTVAGGAGPGAEPSVSSGVVSSLDRSVHGFGFDMWGLIETDSPVPPTADGGALVGTDGSFGLSLHLSADAAMGYAVPIDVAWTVGMDLLEHGRVRAARLGVDSEDVDEVRASELGIAGGARLLDVDPGGAGAEAGLRKGDIVLSLGSSTIRSMRDLTGCMHTHRPGETVQIVVLRGDEQLTLSATLEEKSRT